MNRNEFLRTAALAGWAASQRVVLAEDAPSVAKTDKPMAPPFQFTSQPLLQHPTSDEMVVFVGVNRLATGWVEYGETPELGLRSAGDRGLMPLDPTLLKMRLSGLKPGTRYYYRVHACEIDFRNAYSIHRGVEVRSELHEFTTFDPAAASARISIINDTHEVAATLQGLAKLLAARPSDCLVWNGDMFNDIRSETQLSQQILTPGGVALAADRPLVPVRGNHDVRGAQARLLDKYFDLPVGLWYYTLRIGPVALLVLDTGEDKPDSAPVYAGLNDFAGYRTQQQQWLQTALQRDAFKSAKFRVATMHIPLIWKERASAGDYCGDGRAKWHELLVEHRIDVVISGHTHEPGWFAPGQQAPYGQLVGGGPKPDAATLIEVHADSQKLSLITSGLDGRERSRYELTTRG
ncbi:MAG: FN3 domain-containing metallophosphoesterase family protein [Pirellulales bacterium]